MYKVDRYIIYIYIDISIIYLLWRRSRRRSLLITCYKVPEYYDLDAGRLIICSYNSP